MCTSIDCTLENDLICFSTDIMVTERMNTFYPHLSSIFLSFFLSFGAAAPILAIASSFTSFLDHTRLLCTGYQLVAETCTWQHTTLTTNIHAPGGIRSHNLSRQAAEDLRLRPRGHWDRRSPPPVLQLYSPLREASHYCQLSLLLCWFDIDAHKQTSCRVGSVWCRRTT
jgi:hypothetical protein